MNSKLALLLFVLCLSLAIFKPFAADAAPNAYWPQWRGPAGTGVSAETNVPTEWSENKNIKWKTPLPGRGHSSPIVWDERIFLTTDSEGEMVSGAQAVKHVIQGQELRKS